jgi:hypothetical protein
VPPISLGAEKGITAIAMCMKDSWEGIGSNMVSPLAWAHVSSLCLPESVVQAQHRSLLFSHFINLGFGGALVPRLIVGRDGLPAVVAHIYAVPLRGTEWKFDLTDVDNHTIRNVVLRLQRQVPTYWYLIFRHAGGRSEAVRSARHATQLFGVVHTLLERLEKEINSAASATMPPRLFATRYWSNWFDKYGNVDFRRK